MEGLIAAQQLARSSEAGGVAPEIAAEALSRRRVLQGLKLVPVPAAAAGEETWVAAAAAEAAANAEANARLAGRCRLTLSNPR